MPGPAKKPVKNRPVSSFEKPDATGPDAVQRADKDAAVKAANAPKVPNEVDLKPKGEAPTAKTLVVMGPPQVSKKDATGMMASKPMDMAPPPMKVTTTQPGVDPRVVARQVGVTHGPAQPELHRPAVPAAEPLMQDVPLNMLNVGPTAAAGAPMGLSVQLAQDIIRKLKASGRIK
jgi:hypothetical protein